MVVKVIFTDLDGTLLNEDYTCDDAIKIIEKLKSLKVPIIFVSGKTRYEQEVFREELGIDDPFVVEDGSAIYIPHDYFDELQNLERVEDYYVLVLGTRVSEIYKMIDKLRLRYNILSYNYMSVEEIAKLTGLSVEMAKLCKKREFSETIVEADDEALEILRKYFNVKIGGRFIHIYGKNASKGRAVKILTELYRKMYKNVITIGIGNSYTDIDMLKVVDIPALVRNNDGWISVDFPVYKARGIATQGWVEVIKRFILD